MVVSLTATTVDGQLEQLSKAVSEGATAVELNLDLIDSLNAEVDIPKLLHSRTVPVIVNFRYLSICSPFI